MLCCKAKGLRFDREEQVSMIRNYIAHIGKGTVFVEKILLGVAFCLGILLFFSLKSAGVESNSSPPLREARYYTILSQEGWVQCQLCPRRCVLAEGQRGVCGVRINKEGTLYTLAYGNPCALHVDPIEKKPIFHMQVGSRSLSIAIAGCNLACVFCQNWQLSRSRPDETTNYDLPPEKAVELAVENGCQTIAYTYTEPTIFYEYALDTAKLAHSKGLKILWISCGYINPEPLRELCPYLDGAAIGLKGFSDEVYQSIGAAQLSPILETVRILKEEGVWLELVYLVIPTLNDDLDEIEEMCLWIKENLGEEVPLHFSRFSPHYKLIHLPPTPVETLEKARKIAQKTGLKYVYIGNVPGHPGQNTYCPHCQKLLIERIGYFIAVNHIEEGKCKFCGETIPGAWK